jgi:hypothetical protein
MNLAFSMIMFDLSPLLLTLLSLMTSGDFTGIQLTKTHWGNELLELWVKFELKKRKMEYPLF